MGPAAASFAEVAASATKAESVGRLRGIGLVGLVGLGEGELGFGALENMGLNFSTGFGSAL